MKKAYVKPVFLAEEFVMTDCVASCPTSTKVPGPIEDKTNVCVGDNGHKVNLDKGLVGKYWSYADDDSTMVYLFTNATYECDFLWNSTGSNVEGWSTNGTEGGLVWDQAKREKLKLTSSTNYSFGQKLIYFFTGDAKADNKEHVPGFMTGKFFS